MSLPPWKQPEKQTNRRAGRPPSGGRNAGLPARVCWPGRIGARQRSRGLAGEGAPLPLAPCRRLVLRSLGEGGRRPEFFGVRWQSPALRDGDTALAGCAPLSAGGSSPAPPLPPLETRGTVRALHQGTPLGFVPLSRKRRRAALAAALHTFAPPASTHSQPLRPLRALRETLSPTN